MCKHCSAFLRNSFFPSHFSHERRKMREGRGAVGNGRFLLAHSEGNCKTLITKIKFEGELRIFYFETVVSFLNALMQLL